MKNPNAERPPSFDGGSRLTLYRQHQAGRKPVHVKVVRIENSRIWVESSSGAVGLDGAVVLEYMIGDDCRYLAQGKIEVHSADCSVISWDGEWRRVQSRCFVRISTHGIEVEVKEPVRATKSQDAAADARPPEDGKCCFEMLDISAGGLRFETAEPFEFDAEFVCHFELPGQSRYELPAKVVRSQTKPGFSDRYRVAVEFVDHSEELRSKLLQWIYHEQVRRHHTTRRAS